jgi:hypothetical protein
VVFAEFCVKLEFKFLMASGGTLKIGLYFNRCDFILEYLFAFSCYRNLGWDFSLRSSRGV